MKTYLGPTIALALVAGILAFGWYRTSQKAGEDHANATQLAEALTNQVNQMSTDLAESRSVNSELRISLEKRAAELLALSNKMESTASDLASTSAKLDESKTMALAQAEAAKAEISQRDQRITGLEAEKGDLTQKLSGLNKQIVGLETRIGEYRRQLAESEGDRSVLLTHLRDLQSQKADLERKFQDLETLREEVRRRREEVAIAKRQEFRRKGAYAFEKKGAELVQNGLVGKPKTPTDPANRNLSVDVDTSGGARVVKPDAPKSSVDETKR